MALVDTQGFVMAVDRSLFGPQGRRWIERKLPGVATNIAFIVVSAFGACTLVYHITRGYHESGYWAILQIPKHVLNAFILHLVARALRWHVDRMLGLNFAAGDEALPDFFGASARAGPDGGGDHKDKGNIKGGVLWPWQSSHGPARATPQQPKRSATERRQEPSDSVESTTTDQEQHGWWGVGKAGGEGGGKSKGSPRGGGRGGGHRRSRSVGQTPPSRTAGRKEPRGSPLARPQVAAVVATSGAASGASATQGNSTGAAAAAAAAAAPYAGAAGAAAPAGDGKSGEGRGGGGEGDGVAAAEEESLSSERRGGGGSRDSRDGAGGDVQQHDDDDDSDDNDSDDGHSDEGGGGGGGHNPQLTFPDLFGSCRPSPNNDKNQSRGGRRSASSTPSSPAPVATEKGSPADRRPRSLDRNRGRAGRRRASLEPSRTVQADRWIHVGSGDSVGNTGVGGGGERDRAPEGGRAARQGGWTSDDGGAGGQGAGYRGSLRRLQSLTGSSSEDVVSRDSEAEGQPKEAKRDEEEGKTGGEGVSTVRAAAAIVTAAVGITGGGGGGGGRRWKPIDKLSRALGGSSRRRSSLQGGAAGGEDEGEGGELQQPKLNFFTEDDLDELLYSTFFIKMCDDASWLYVEDHPFQPDMNWLLSLWGGYKIAPRFQGEVKQNEAHRMLFQAETGRLRGHVRIRSRATNTFLFFLGIKQPLTWVAWDRDVVGGQWEDMKLEWVGKPQGPEGVLVGDERGRVVIRSRAMNGYVSWNGSRFTHVPGREGAAVFMLQRMAPSSSSSSSSKPSKPSKPPSTGYRRRTQSRGGAGTGSLR